MVKNDVIDAITFWTEWAGKTEIGRYDIALLKIWIQFEKFMSDLFVRYATGNSSEEGFRPALKLNFTDESQLNAFLREGNRTYIDYLPQIKKLSKYIFNENPFDIVFSDNNVYNAYVQIISIRNNFAHESGESKSKMIKTCFGGREDYFKEPNIYLLSKERSTNKTYYTYYVDIIKDCVNLLVDPPR